MVIPYWLKITAVCLILLVITSATTYHFYIVGNYEKLMGEKNVKIKDLEKDKEKLGASNQSLEQEIKKRDEINKQMLGQIVEIQKRDGEIQRQLIDSERRINSAARTSRLNDLRNSEKAEQLLSTINRSANCDILNFARGGGSCKAGVWQPLPSQRP